MWPCLLFLLGLCSKKLHKVQEPGRVPARRVLRAPLSLLKASTVVRSAALEAVGRHLTEGRRRLHGYDHWGSWWADLLAHLAHGAGQTSLHRSTRIRAAGSGARGLSLQKAEDLRIWVSSPLFLVAAPFGNRVSREATNRYPQRRGTPAPYPRQRAGVGMSLPVHGRAPLKRGRFAPSHPQSGCTSSSRCGARIFRSDGRRACCKRIAAAAEWQSSSTAFT